MLRAFALAGVASTAALMLAACGGGGESSTAASTTTTTETAAAPAAPAAPATDTSQERADAAPTGDPAGVTPAPDATAGATPADVAAPAAPAAAAAAAGGATTAIAGLTGDVARGQRVFMQCRTCHVLDAGVNRVGPSLNGIIGRRAGTVPNFRYSPANRASGVTWTEERLFAYLENPRAFMPGTYMSFVGLRQPQQRADVIAYIRANGG